MHALALGPSVSHVVQEALQRSSDNLACRDAAIHELQTQHARVCATYQEQLAAQAAALQQRDADAALLAEKEAQLTAAQARLAQVAPIMRRIASRAAS